MLYNWLKMFTDQGSQKSAIVNTDDIALKTGQQWSEP